MIDPEVAVLNKIVDSIEALSYRIAKIEIYLDKKDRHWESE